jgi:hypothetical protein
MPDQPPMNVYPDPNGGTRSNLVPADTTTSSLAIASGGISAGTAATSLMSSLIVHTVAFIQSAPGARTMDLTTFLGFHDIGPRRAAVIFIFGAISVLLQVINLVRGIQMKDRLKKLSQQVWDVCAKAGLLTNKAA